MPTQSSADQHTFDESEERTHSFIVKVWLEDPVASVGQAAWRGRITHVPSGKRRYFRDLGDIAAFITPYLLDMGVKFSLWARLRHSLVVLIHQTRANDV